MSSKPRETVQALAWGMVWVLVCALLAPSAVTAQGTPRTLRVTTRLVVVNVVVRTKKGAPVAGLTRDDFTVLDNGKKRPLSIFSVERSGAPHAPRKPLPPNVFSNFTARDGSVPANPVVILLDDMDTGWADAYFARRELTKFILRLPQGDRVAIYELGPRGLEVLQDFTTSPAPLLEAARGYRGYTTAGPAASGPRTVAALPLVGEADAAARFEEELRDLADPYQAGYRPGYHGMSALAAIKMIAGRLSGLPGRKSLVWVTDCVPYPGPAQLNLGSIRALSHYADPTPMERVMRNAVRSLNQADVALCPVDAHGLAAMGPDYQIVPMHIWAKRTGGRAYYFTNGLAQAMRHAVELSEVSYTLGYYPSDVPWNGGYRHIKVRVDRKGLRLYYRRGYYAGAAVPNARTSATSQLEAAAASPLDSTGLGVTVRLTPAGNAPSRLLRATVYIDAKGLTFQPVSGGYETSFDLWAGQYSRQGALLGATAKKVSLKLNETQYRITLAGGVGMALREAAKSRAWQLRVAVQDAASGVIGSVRVPLHRMDRAVPARGPTSQVRTVCSCRPAR